MSRTIRRNIKTDEKIIKDGAFQYTSIHCKHHGFCEICRTNRQFDLEKIKQNAKHDIKVDTI